MHIRYCLFLAATVLLLTACHSGGTSSSQQHTNPKQAATNKVFASKKYGIRLQYPADLLLRHDFQHSYLNNGRWKTYAGPRAASGQALVALVMPGSNAVTSGELRIGVSRQPAALAHCTRPPDSARKSSIGQAVISGVPFTTYKASDAAMSHYLIVRSYRTVYHNTCYALDVLVYGSNPRVYDPPRTPPFSRKYVFQRLIPVAQGLQFLPARKKQPGTAQ